jgi:hypothetical protein
VRGQPEVVRGPLRGEPVEPSEAVRSGPDPRVTLPPGLVDAEHYLVKGPLERGHPLHSSGSSRLPGWNKPPARVVGRRGAGG